METYVMWATILSPVVAVLIAAFMTYKSNKDTRKQLQGLKNLCIMQISNTIDMLEMELYKFSLGKEDDKNELTALHNELYHLRQEEKPNSKELDKIKHKIEKLSLDVRYKDTFSLRIINRQFGLMEAIDKVKRMK